MTTISLLPPMGTKTVFRSLADAGESATIAYKAAKIKKTTAPQDAPETREIDC
jgi:hypothetical protein